MVSLHSSVECVQLVCWDLLAAETLALGQLCFCCWAGRSKFFFFLHYETHSTDPTNAEVSRVGCFFSLSCQSSAKEGGLTQPRRGGLELGWLGHSPRIPWNMPGISSWHCCWPEEHKFTIFSQGSCPPGALCPVIQRNISKWPFLLQTPRKQSQRQLGWSESHRNTPAHILYLAGLSDE